MPRESKAARAARERTEFERQVGIAEREGLLNPRVWKNGCGRCGGDITVFKYAEQTSRAKGGTGIEIKALPMCPVCRIDRVKRWGDLLQGSAERGVELRTFPSTPYARALSAAGYVTYNREDGAWELTPAGLELLRARGAKEETNAA